MTPAAAGRAAATDTKKRQASACRFFMELVM